MIEDPELGRRKRVREATDCAVCAAYPDGQQEAELGESQAWVNYQQALHAHYLDGFHDSDAVEQHELRRRQAWRGRLDETVKKGAQDMAMWWRRRKSAEKNERERAQTEAAKPKELSPAPAEPPKTPEPV